MLRRLKAGGAQIGSMHNENVPEKVIKTVRILRVVTVSVTPAEDQSFVLSIIENLCYQCYEHKIVPSVVICDENNYVNSLDKTIAEGIDALIVLTYDMHKQYIRELISFSERNIPIIVLGTSMVDTNISTVNLGNAELSYMGVKHLYECGYRSVGYLHSNYDLWCFNDRAVGFYEAIEAFHMECPIQISVESTISGAHREMRDWLKKKQPLPRAFFADNDNTALGAMNALVEAGYRIPEDISLVAMDDIVYSAFSSTPLTTIHVSRKQIARVTIDLLMGDYNEDPVRITCLGHLIVRKSTRSFDPETEDKMIFKT